MREWGSRRAPHMSKALLWWHSLAAACELLRCAAVSPSAAAGAAGVTVCGGGWQPPCDGNTCGSDTVLYAVGDTCAPCGGNGDFCCPVGDKWLCDTGLTCRTLPDPFDALRPLSTASRSQPFGLALLCVHDTEQPVHSVPADHATAAETTADSRGAVDHRSHDAETAAPGDQTPGPASRRNASTVGDGAANAAPSDAVASAVKQPTPTIPASSGPPQASDAASTGAKTPNRACARAYQPCGGASSPIDHECCEPGYPCTSINPWLRACLPAGFSDEAAHPGELHKPALAPASDRSSNTTSRDGPPDAGRRGDGHGEGGALQNRGRGVHKGTGHMEWRRSKSPAVAGATQWKYPLDTMLGMSFFFYELQRAGPLPAGTRAPWRGDSLKRTRGRGNLDGALRGGYFDAGDHNKFMLPGAYAVARLAWTVHRHAASLKRTHFDGRSNYAWAREAAKWGADFMWHAVERNRLVLHIGDVKKDHNYIGRAELYPQIGRNIRYAKKGEASDIAGEAAAALAHAAVAFADQPRLSAAYWRKAQMAYELTGVDAGRLGNSNDAYSVLKSYYPSSGVVSHVFYGAASMLAACRALRCKGEARYERQALKLAVMKEADGGQKWYWEVPGWDNAWWEGAAIMAGLGFEGPKIDSNPAFTHFLAAFADKWTNGRSPIKLSPLGQRFILQWGSNRYAAAGAAVLLMWADLDASMQITKRVSPQDARCAAVKQLHYIAGDNDRGSYVAGWGESPPQRNHHRNAVCAPWEQMAEPGKVCDRLFFDVADPNGQCPKWQDRRRGVCYVAANRPNKFQTHGALIGGPKTPTDAGSASRKPYSTRGWNDWRTDWVGSEQAVDYNAGYTMALAAAIELPRSFWTSKCGGVKTDLQLNRKAGMRRTAVTYPNDKVYTFKDFEPWTWTRSLRADWMQRLP